MSETEYPSWRDAISDSDKIANLRCGLKYIFWHTAYLLLAAFGVIIVGGATLLDRITGSSVATAVRNALDTPTAKKISRYAVDVVLIIGMIITLWLLITIILMDPVAFAIALTVVIALFLTLFAGAIVWEKVGPRIRGILSQASKPIVRGASKAGSKAVETPGVRRVYGNCPVSMDIEPKWFENLFDK